MTLQTFCFVRFAALMSVIILRSIGPVRSSAASIVSRFELFVLHFARTSADNIYNMLDELLHPHIRVVSDSSITELMLMF